MTTADHQPTRLDEALRLVAQGATPLAGATALFSARSLPEGELVDVIRCGLGGMLLAAKALLDRTAEPTDEQIADALSGNPCRCTGYAKIAEAVKAAAAALQSAERA